MGQFSNSSSKMEDERTKQSSASSQYENNDVISLTYTDESIAARDLKFGTQIYGTIF